MSFVSIQNLRKEYDDIVAVNDVSIDIEEGEFVSILGPSGSGKTTMLKSIAGFVKPTDGQITVSGKDLVGLPPEDRNMGLVFQRLALFPHMTVHDNVAFGLRHRTDLSEPEITDRIEEILEVVSLPGFEDRNIQNLSGGQQQRVALARVLVLEPDLLLFDEPLSDLDRQLREELRREIRDLHDRLGITSIYVTHNQREALTLSDRVLVLHEGEKVRCAPPSEVYSDPQSKFVADFVGDSNFLAGKTIRQNGTIQFKYDGFSLPLDGTPMSDDGECILHIRPEDIKINTTTNNKPTYEGRIASTVHLGSVSEYQIEVNGTTFLSTELGAPQYSEGETVTISFANYGPVGE
ncbi:ABC transporter ATP-binding protein [Halorubrum vacuolatum]|uniref:Molybdate/tungstate import ATP-binding protein WtpC n=1 Tax=Halorubrum vacuolatum TaxID=63740 RepID=A0A238Y6R9_HALVU|nr:ABC transporter ATP-binding protein [Halorubrum vacuolatum]SNR66807.1 putative spermidine/putrescine transport system ATP-binding protein/spermidine/putrescine transport system ATP-binding protein [Halorubrum vacuolatum]